VVDPGSLAVRSQAAKALGSLFKLITELVGAIRANEDAVAASIAAALAQVVKGARENLGPLSRRALSDVMKEAFSGTHEGEISSNNSPLTLVSPPKTRSTFLWGSSLGRLHLIIMQ